MKKPIPNPFDFPSPKKMEELCKMGMGWVSAKCWKEMWDRALYLVVEHDTEYLFISQVIPCNPRRFELGVVGRIRKKNGVICTLGIERDKVYSDTYTSVKLTGKEPCVHVLYPKKEIPKVQMEEMIF